MLDGGREELNFLILTVHGGRRSKEAVREALTYCQKPLGCDIVAINLDERRNAWPQAKSGYIQNPLIFFKHKLNSKQAYKAWVDSKYKLREVMAEYREV